MRPINIHQTVQNIKQWSKIIFYIVVLNYFLYFYIILLQKFSRTFFTKDNKMTFS